MTPDQRRDLLASLDKAGEALKATGEGTIIVGYYPADQYRLQEGYSVRLELEGTSGIQEGGHTLSAAYLKALAACAEKKRELEERAEIEAEVLQRLLQRAQRKAA